MNNTKFKLGRGLDVGTGILCMAQMTESGEVAFKSVRDSFLEITPPNKLVFSTMKKGLIKAGINFFELEDKFYILGDDALITSIERQIVVRRPMAKGVISPTEAKGLPMFKALVKELLGPPQTTREKVVFTVPAAPADAHFDIIYHESVIQSVLEDLGYNGKSMNESHAMSFTELGEDDYTGMCISMGAGQTNIAICNVADLICSFSVARGGDYIDYQTATSLGYDPNSPLDNQVTPNLVTYIKEQGVDILKPDKSDKIKISIAAHYRSLIRYIVDNLVKKVNAMKQGPKFMLPIPVVIAGGTSLAPGALEMFTEELYKQKHLLPFDIKEIRHSKKPLQAIAEGCLLALLSEED
jgi:hypothetical protein